MQTESVRRRLFNLASEVELNRLIGTVMMDLLNFTREVSI
jgi:hypothetical protein